MSTKKAKTSKTAKTSTKKTKITKKTETTPKTDSHLERRFENLWKTHFNELPLEKQVKGIVPGKRYVYDFKVSNCLFEIQGGIWARGYSGHTSGAGIKRDSDKVNKAQLQGYVIFQLTEEKLNESYLREIYNFITAR